MCPQDGEKIFQKNEGQWEFSIEEDDNGQSLVLEVDVGKYLDTSLIKVRAGPGFGAEGGVVLCDAPSGSASLQSESQIQQEDRQRNATSSIRKEK